MKQPADPPASLHYFVELKATPALQDFRNIVGKANYHFNSLLVGLSLLAAQAERPAVRLVVPWEPSNFQIAAKEAESFATHSVLVYAVAALERYLDGLVHPPVTVVNTELRSMLTGEFQKQDAETPMSRKAVDDLMSALKAQSDTAQTPDILETFRARFMPRAKPPSLRARFDALADVCPSLPHHFRAAIHMLIAWRNRHAHSGYLSPLSPSLTKAWNDGRPALATTNPRAKPDALLNRFVAGDDPTADDLATLLALLHRTVSTIDGHLINTIDLERFTWEVMVLGFRGLPDAEASFKLWWGRTERDRIAKFQGLAGCLGLRRVTRSKKNQPQLTLPDTFWFGIASRPRLEVYKSFDQYTF